MEDNRKKNYYKKNNKNHYYKKNNQYKKNYYQYSHANKPSNDTLPDNDNVTVSTVVDNHYPTYEELVLKDREEEEVLHPKRSNVFLILGYSLAVILLIVLLIGGSYAYFIYSAEDSRESTLRGGEFYINVSPENTSVNITTLYPMTKEDARQLNNNVFTFTVTGKNTATDRILDYDIIVVHGNDVSGKIRINDDDLRFDLIEITLDENDNPQETVLLDGVSYSLFKYNDVIRPNTTTAVTRQFKARFWISEDVLISDTEEGRDYTQAQFKNLFATFKIGIESRDYEV